MGFSLSSLYKNKWMVVSYSAACLFASVFALRVTDSLTLPLLFLSLLLCLLVASSKNLLFKNASFFLLGLSSYYVSLSAFSSPSALVIPLLTPFFFLAVSNATAALVAYASGFRGACAFTVASLVAFTMVFGPADFVSLDRFVLAMAFFLVSCFVYAFAVSKAAGIREGILNVIQSAVASSLLLGIIIALPGMDASVLPDFSSFISPTASSAFTSVAWFSFVSSAFLCSVILFTFNILLYSTEFVRRQSEGEVAYSFVGTGEPFSFLKPKKKTKDPYSKLIKELNKFISKGKSLDKLKRVELISRFSREYDLLSSKYKHHSQKKARELLKKASALKKR